MAFQFKRDLTGAPPIITKKYLATNNEAIAKGEALKLVQGRLTLASGSDAVFAVANETIVAGTDKAVEVILVTPTQIYEVPYTAAPSLGSVVTIHTDGLSVTNTTTSGVCGVYAVDTAKQLAEVSFKVRQVN